jgi:hypothetical protein
VNDDGRLIDTRDDPTEAWALRDDYETTLKALGIADQHQVVVRPIRLPANAQGRRPPCFGIYVRDL